MVPKECGRRTLLYPEAHGIVSRGHQDRIFGLLHKSWTWKIWQHWESLPRLESSNWCRSRGSSSNAAGEIATFTY